MKLLTFFLLFYPLYLHTEDDPCIIASNYNLYIESIQKEEKWMHGNDSCVLEIIENMFNDIKDKNDLQLYIIVNNILKNSDGYVAEALSMNIFYLFEKKPHQLLQSIFQINKNRIVNSIEEELITQIELEYYDSRMLNFKDFKTIINDLYRKKSITKEEKCYLYKIDKKLKNKKE